jgi:hypothetical protein
MTHENFDKLLERYPEITSEGFGTPIALFELRRQELREAYTEWLLCVQWLLEHELEGEDTAESLKDRVRIESKLDHPIPRGSFILAALYLGCVVETIQGSTDALICFSYGDRTSRVLPGVSLTREGEL